MIWRPADHSARRTADAAGGEEGLERAAAEHPDSFMRRREFLGRTAALAGTAGLAAAPGVETVVAEAARRASSALPSPRNMPLDTFVVLMMENRSFDHYFGWHPRADGRNRDLRYPDLEGRMHATHRLTPDFQGCGHRDPDHGWEGGRWQWHRGRNDRFLSGNVDGSGSDEFAIGYYEKSDIPFIPHAADAFTLYDRWFCSIMGSTYPNRHYQWAAQCGGQKGNDIPAAELGNQWETIADRATANGVSFAYFNSDIPFSALYGVRGLGWTRPIAEFYARAAAGTLPNICFVDPPFRDGGGGDGLSADEHPHGDIRLGQAFMSDVAHAFLESPQYRRGALFVNYDEWGGFFDHVPPPFVPDDRRSRKLADDFGFTGFRVPGVVISPFTRGPRVSHMAVTHESILKLISYRFGLGHLNRRHRYASNIGRSFNWRRPKLEPPELPDPSAIAAIPCSLQSGTSRDAQRPKPHDMGLLETTGYLDRLGYEVPEVSFESLFREPDSVRGAFERSTPR